MISASQLLDVSDDSSVDSAIRIEAEIEPQAGPRTPVKPAVYEGGRYQLDRRWPSGEGSEPVDVVVIDNVPSQANRLEAALDASDIGLPRLVLDLRELPTLPAHLPRELSSFRFPHRNADAYLRDSMLDGRGFETTELGKSILGATPWAAGPLVSWFPQALLFGFWQSHLGKHRQQTKHARAWVSEIVGWQPATVDTRSMGLKGDALNLTKDVKITSNEDDRFLWEVGEARIEGAKKDKLSETGHGQVPFMKDGDAAPAGVSFSRITQTSTVSFSQLRRISTGVGADADAAARALVVAVGIYAHVAAFGRGFSLRSGADLRVSSKRVTWLGGSAEDDREVGLPDLSVASELVAECHRRAQERGVPLEGWLASALRLSPKPNLRKAIESTWPLEA